MKYKVGDNVIIKQSGGGKKSNINKKGVVEEITNVESDQLMKVRLDEIDWWLYYDDEIILNNQRDEMLELEKIL